jgi:hypothetical protein
MTITAKFASLCPVCSQRIQIGESVEWQKGQKARHITCPARQNSQRGHSDECPVFGWLSDDEANRSPHYHGRGGRLFQHSGPCPGQQPRRQPQCTCSARYFADDDEANPISPACQPETLNGVRGWGRRIQ